VEPRRPHRPTETRAIAVSLVTPEPPLQIKKMVRQCHSPEPMGQQQTAEDIVASKGGDAPADD